MSWLEALLLGIIQGLTEFFPVSSSAHLQMVQTWLGMEHLSDYIMFDLICHAGTLCAVLWVLRFHIWNALMVDRTTFWQVVVATLPLFPVVLLIKPIHAIFDTPVYTSFLIFLNACWLFWITRPRALPAVEVATTGTWRDTCIVGMCQAIAIVPGISRSGMTIGSGWLLGWSYEKAIVFSFLLSIPAVLGGIGYEGLKWFKQPMHVDVSMLSYIIGFVASFLVGWVCFLLLFKVFTRKKFRYFAWYCLALAALTFFLS